MHVVFPAGPRDAQALAEVHVTSWRETYRGLLPDSFLDRMSVPVTARRFSKSLVSPAEHEITLAAADRSGIVGYAAGGASRTRLTGEAEITTLYVLRAHQGHDLGRRLLTGAARVFADQGARSLMISVLRDNFPARGFYEHLGGQADTPRKEPGPGGLMYEVSYRWPDISALI
ncbi:MAG: GNAT family N-acetyltransferase [Phenylobacterium sp.]|uniref:GNAT family N-acetyltransferase n=1 Tax=Phenylobacterium sp. TaxID=1871053 RepID=UPI001B4825E7|nr:GNAT family N-acetyltransferase [Phenylobacterium sp.]MBP7816420.1 GNAT family N-acetyltransferase [Phenylobacterium sp.]MBP9232298.1 GNAT family N-acetyltransferase [Phenylobacterium sp.]